MKQKFVDIRNNQTKGWLITIAITALLVLCIFLIFESVIVVGESMLPNFYGGTSGNVKSGDKVIISKIYKLDYGDVIVFHRNSKDDNLIKRVIGLPGDTIEIFEGKLYRNSKLVQESYIKEPMNPVHINASWKLKDDEIFVMGDNRNNSLDSREFGPINKKSVLGEVIIHVTANDGKIYFM